MNNRQNGRRRGRGGQQTRNGQPGSPDRGNRIDNRARGNAAQLLEKYKNLARDAQTQGDRVNTEYYLQFADHYFRVLSESRSRFEEQRPQRRDEFRDDFGQDDFDGEGQRETQADGGWNDGEDEQQQRPAPRRFERGERPERAERGDRNRDRGERAERSERDVQADAEAGDDVTGEDAEVRTAAPRAERRPRRERANGANGEGRRNGAAPAPREDEVSERIDADRLPLGFATIPASQPDAEVAEPAGEDAPRPRRRAPRKKVEAAPVEA